MNLIEYNGLNKDYSNTFFSIKGSIKQKPVK